MGITASTCSSNTASRMVQASILLLLIPLVSCAPPPPPEYPTPAPAQGYQPDIGQTNVGGYGVNKDPYCHMVEKVVFENQCEPYTETTCWTQNHKLGQEEEGVVEGVTGVDLEGGVVVVLEVERVTEVVEEATEVEEEGSAAGEDIS